MNFEEILAKISAFVKTYWLPLALGVFGLLFVLYGLIYLLSTNQKSHLEFSQNTPQQELASKSAVLITIDVEGAVEKPGVYKLELGSIIQDALVSAGGLSKQADRDFVSKSINLASKLTDSEKIYIPSVGEKPAGQVQGAATVSTNDLININSASEQELDSLPGVGPVTAQKIINARPFNSIDDLLNKKVVSSKVYSEIQEKITAY